MSSLGEVAALLRKATKGEKLSWSDHMLLNHFFADEVLPRLCKHYKSKRIHAFRMVISRALTHREPLVYFEHELLDELFKLLKKAAKVSELRDQMKDFIASRTAAKLMAIPPA